MKNKLNFNEVDLLNATWGGMKALQSKKKKDSTDLNALSKGTSAITKFMDMKLRYQKYLDTNPESRKGETLFLN